MTTTDPSGLYFSPMSLNQDPWVDVEPGPDGGWAITVHSPLRDGPPEDLTRYVRASDSDAQAIALGMLQRNYTRVRDCRAALARAPMKLTVADLCPAEMPLEVAP